MAMCLSRKRRAGLKRTFFLDILWIYRSATDSVALGLHRVTLAVDFLQPAPWAENTVYGHHVLPLPSLKRPASIKTFHDLSAKVVGGLENNLL